ncbi:TatD family hydrolase [Micrococcales bacterium 31B]|nr:TatD family hydrolase [Micrococcales bacterium 31B]
MCAEPIRERKGNSAKNSRDLTWPPVPEALPHPVVDNHTHFDIRDGSVEFSIRARLDQAAAVGVPRAVQIGCDLDSARWTAQMVEGFPELVAGVAIHPNEAPLHARGHDHAGRPLVSLDEALHEIEALLGSTPKMRVVGETGLDYFRTSRKDAAALAAQADSFRAHIALAKKHGLALQIHDRDAHADVLRILREEGAPERTVFHCYSGDAEMARECVEAGYFLSFAGTVTFKSARDLREAVVVTPLAQMLVETDAPYLTPEPFRGRPNASYLVPHTLRLLADLKDVPLEHACREIEATSERVYGAW